MGIARIDVVGGRRRVGLPVELVNRRRPDGQHTQHHHPGGHTLQLRVQRLHFVLVILGLILIEGKRVSNSKHADLGKDVSDSLQSDADWSCPQEIRALPSSAMKVASFCVKRSCVPQMHRSDSTHLQ